MVRDELPLELNPIAERDGWFRTELFDWTDAEALVLQIQDNYPLGDSQLICGLLEEMEGHAIFLIENISAIEIAREFETGSHNAWPEPETDQVCSDLRRVFEVAPFRPFFADAAGYKCRFNSPLTRAQAKAIEKIITVGLEAYDPGEDFENPDWLTEIVISENGLRLWWD